MAVLNWELEHVSLHPRVVMQDQDSQALMALKPTDLVYLAELQLSQKKFFFNGTVGTSLVVQWLRICTPTARGPRFNSWLGN